MSEFWPGLTPEAPMSERLNDLHQRLATGDQLTYADRDFLVACAAQLRSIEQSPESPTTPDDRGATA